MGNKGFGKHLLSKSLERIRDIQLGGKQPRGNHDVVFFLDLNSLEKEADNCRITGKKTECQKALLKSTSSWSSTDSWDRRI